MKPIWRLRMRARCDGVSCATGSPASVYSPSVGVSSRPRIESSVVLPQPDGPSMATYSPGWISTWMSCERVGLHLVGVEDLLDPGEADQRPGCSPVLAEKAAGDEDVDSVAMWMGSEAEVDCETGRASVNVRRAT